MNRITARVWIGGGLVLVGLLMLLERFGLFQGIVSVVWGAFLALAGAYFLNRFLQNRASEWWAAIPAFALLGIAATILLSPVLSKWSGFFFLGALGLGFFAVYWSDRQRWWALIPGGVLLTLGIVAVLGDVFGARDTGGAFFLGLGLTFVLVALLAELQWAWIPGLVLLVMGGLIGLPFSSSMGYIWPAALILGGLLLILQFARKH